MVWGSKGPLGVAPPNAPCLPGLVRARVRRSDKHHIAGKPTDLMRALVRIAWQGGTILDPFCGSGTTLVEAMKRDISATGIDANPSSHFAARVKTNWNLDGEVLLDQLDKIKSLYDIALKRLDCDQDPFFDYLSTAGFLRRQWISLKPLRKVVALKRAIAQLRIGRDYKDALLLALIAETVRGSANVKFGPELYRGKVKRDSSVFTGFKLRVMQMSEDLALVKGFTYPPSRLILGDARVCGKYLRRTDYFQALICSPPYPTEHDYTRNSRLELALLGIVTGRESLRMIKQGMIRSHTKGIYSSDSDGRLVRNHKVIESLAKTIDKKAESKTHGFARLYSTVLREYFGGIKRHFHSVKPLMAPNALCAYVVGDQSSYLQVHIPTAEILAGLARDVGYQHVETRRWRRRRSTATGREIAENILILRIPANG